VVRRLRAIDLWDIHRFLCLFCHGVTSKFLKVKTLILTRFPAAPVSGSSIS